MMDKAICKEVIITTLTRRGKGVEGSPIRIVTQIWDKDGTLIAENDPEFDRKIALLEDNLDCSMLK